MNKKVIIISACLITVLGIIFGIIDYNRINALKEPLFMIRITTGDGTTQHYIGIGYRMKREVELSYIEPYYMDNEIRFGLWFYTKKLNFNEEKEYEYTLDIIKSNTCSKKLYYKENNRNIYLYCLDNILVNTNNVVQLKDYLNNNNINIDEFINLFIENNSYDDGGTTIYKELKDTSNIKINTNEKLTILKCNTLTNNNDIYLGPTNMEYESTFCKNESEYKTFTRTYKIKNIYIEGDYLYIDIEQFQEESSIVKIKKEIATDIKIDYNYEFTFQYIDNNFDDNINSIFENTTLIKIEETDKVGLEQIQDKIE